MLKSCSDPKQKLSSKIAKDKQFMVNELNKLIQMIEAFHQKYPKCGKRKCDKRSATAVFNSSCNVYYNKC